MTYDPTDEQIEDAYKAVPASREIARFVARYANRLVRKALRPVTEAEGAVEGRTAAATIDAFLAKRRKESQR